MREEQVSYAYEGSRDVTHLAQVLPVGSNVGGGVALPISVDPRTSLRLDNTKGQCMAMSDIEHRRTLTEVTGLEGQE